ncbi:hypothetical protein BDM02DRAFT_3182029 [Thelephora ganbajun]|uniref:Uncharacterized protein n=1 Tax=Thelephora ganbajun TaxID=370292 RepID=A0ACB6ZX75_THEGA|nr:hypothetical protein BDM02DRAFT_3182029 [Thelephora ganbajun]
MDVTIRTSEDSLLGDKDYLSTLPLPSASHSNTFGRRKRAFFTTATLVSLFFLTSYLIIQQRASDRFGVDLKPIPFKPEDVEPPSNATYPIASLYSGARGPPTPLFRDNLLPDKQYLTSWPSAGWSNDVMAFGNLIYLALITDRIPVIPKFTPSHVLVDGHADDLPFGEVFDIPRLASLIKSPILEWRDIKIDESPVVESMGCWAIWPEQQYYDSIPREGWFPRNSGLDVSYTRAPSWVKANPGNEHDKTSRFWDLARLSFPDARREWLNNGQAIQQTPSPILNVIEDPDQQMLCMDYLYFAAAIGDVEYDYDFSPAWRFVVAHMHWTERLEAIGELYLRSTFGLKPSQPIPPYITIHIRHGDFSNWCNGVPLEECFAPIPVIARRVREVQEELSIKYPGMNVKHVIMTSDERDEAWWDLVRAQGWCRIDHSSTAAQYGRWYPVIIDAIVQSKGMGFVGTDRSTFSIISRRRVEDWQRGVARTVKWGYRGADDH